MLKKYFLVSVLVTLSFGLHSASCEETKIMYLSGMGKNVPEEWEFYCTEGQKSGEWTTIQVPSNWELQGFGTYNYGHDMEKGSEQGKYRYRLVLSRFKSRTLKKGSMIPLNWDPQ